MESEAIQKLNPELLNDQGLDVICFDGFGAENYEGYLADLSELVGQNETECYENILRVYEKEAGIYQISMRFACVGVVGAGERLEDFADMEKLCSDANFELKKISEGYFTNIVTLLCKAYVGQQKNFTEETTLQFLEAFWLAMKNKTVGNKTVDG